MADDGPVEPRDPGAGLDAGRGLGLGLGLGTMRLSEPGVERDRALRLLHEALDRGVRLFDTADVYGPDAASGHHNETLLAEALGSRRDGVTIATKGGLLRRGKAWIPDGRARHLEAACDRSLRALGADCLDLYQLHAPDPKVPIETSVRALERLRKKGKIRALGLCNVGLEELERARAVAPIASVQVELSVLQPRPLKNGLVAFCAASGIAVLAHSPLGGHRKVKRLSRHPVLRKVGERHGASALEVALAWLGALERGIVPLPGATRLDSLVSSLHALTLELTTEDLADLDAAVPAGRVVRGAGASRRAAADPAGGEIVLFVGYPASGKSTVAASWIESGYRNLNRDTVGGTLAGLLPRLDQGLAAGERRWVLDNTYPRRESRFDVLEIAGRHGVPVRCLWMETSLEQAQVNAVRRMLARHGRLLDASEVKGLEDPNLILPDAQFRFRRELEPPRDDEGFAAIERVPFVEPPRPGAGGARAVLVGALEATASERAVLAGYEARGYRLLQLLYEPRSTDAQGRRRHDGLAMETYFCPHPPGPPVCWCRKPLPGLGLLLVERHGLDPARTIVVESAAADRAFAERLRMRVVPATEFFGGSEIE